MKNDTFEQYVAAVRDDLRSHQDDQDSRWFGEARGAAQCLHLLANQGIVDMDTATVIKRELGVVPQPSITPDQKTSKAYAIFQQSERI